VPNVKFCRVTLTIKGAILISVGSLFSRESAPLLGIDISSSSVKLVELGRDKLGELVLERCAIEPLERGWVSDGNIEKFDEVADALRRLIKKSAARTKNVALALPPSAVITKKITLPDGMTDQELEVQVESEANQYIPFSIDEVSLDFCVIGPSKNSPGDIDVLIAASRREKVQDMQGLAEAAGLKAVILDIESHASRLAASRLITALPNQGVDTMVALFEIGALTTSMQVIRNDEVLYDRDQAFGGAQLTQLIVRQYGFSAEEAESKKRSGDLPEDYMSAVLRPFVEILTQEISRTLQFFYTSTPHNRVDHILLAGGSAPLMGLTEAVTQSLGVACSVVNPFDGMHMGDAVRIKRMAREAPSYLTSCGLAMRRFHQ
jgi:type IV pilus assembly protein PilM